MAYKEPDTALHHLKMAQSYINESDQYVRTGAEASTFIANTQLRTLAQAAEHLNKARALDPEESLWTENEKTHERIKHTQDSLNGDVLLREGIAHLNTSYQICSEYKDSNDKINRWKRNDGIACLEKARDVLEKAFKYRPYSTEILEFLAKVYSQLGDSENYRRILERHVEISPDNITLHKSLKSLNQGSKPEPAFDKPPIISLNAALWLCFPVGLLLGVIGGNTGISALGGFGTLLFIAPIAVWFLRKVWRDYFG